MLTHQCRIIGKRAVCAAICFMSINSFGEAAADVHDAITKGTVSLELRLGFEHSMREDATDTANGLSLRTRLGYRTKEFLDTSVFVQFHNLSNMIEDFRFDPAGNLGGDLRHDVIADPDGSRVHQAYIEFTGLSATRMRIGRQEIVLDDARLIGNVNWRQNGQSFDAVSLSNDAIPNLVLYAAAVNQVNTTSLTDLHLDHLVLLNAKWTIQDKHRLAAFGYLSDTEATAPTARDSVTTGIRLDGDCGDLVRYDLSYAGQDDYNDGRNHDGDMVSAFLELRLDRLQVGVGYSRISGQDGSDRPFDTLFSTAHKFNGWADQFTDTNGGTWSGGLEDTYFQVATDIMDMRLLVRYHFFDSTEGVNALNLHDGEYGRELDVDIQRNLTENLSAQLVYAYYNEVDGSSANPTTDETVFWSRLSYKF